MKLHKRKPGSLTYNGRVVDPEKFNIINKLPAKLSGKCAKCGKAVTGDEAIPSPDPYAQELQSDYKPVVECENCRDASAAEI